MGTGIPQEAIGASAAVLVYSFLCLILVTLLICMLWTYGERWTYVTFLAEFSALSTLGSIAQQIHYNRDWLLVKQDDYETALKAVELPALGLSGVGNEVDLILFTIQFYSYNVMALMVLFWAVKLFCGSWEIRANFLGSWLRENISFLSKIFAVIMPGILVGLGKAPVVLKSPRATFILTNFTMLVSLSIGSILMILILYKYIKTRRLLFAHDKRNGWWGSSGAATATDTTGTCTVNGSGNDNCKASRRSLYDRALITRFTIGFVILLALEVVLIIFSLYSSQNFQKLAKSSSPDFSVSSCIIDIVLFIPGVTTSFLVFLVFGTNKSPRQYKDLVVSVCGRRTKFPKSKRRGVMASGNEEQGTEFQRLPSVSTKVLALTPEEQAVVEAKTRGMLFDQRTSIGTQYTTYTAQTGKSRPGSSVHTHTRTLSPTTGSFNFSHPASARNEFRSVIPKEERDAGEAWARQNDLEIGLALEQRWTDNAYLKEGDSAGNSTAGNTMFHGDLGSMPHRNFLLDDSDEHEGWTR
ncbi:hypothetical protein sscle_08g066920 [Sclerotinia sclerotiorum 1980 UF-70]|uniref:Uncharacterized protein n=1 Tax=Sclerotinia sclerotiorum (strain ATCC 18683 / 1980 / Ss-1) TaxID=665079 RepID=A0A1D9QAX9_SCLS1|nr:hypothetical protein sscle_08g066920 [Sclerotinia sclerotiorum 1980 UF-70]